MRARERETARGLVIGPAAIVPALEAIEAIVRTPLTAARAGEVTAPREAATVPRAVAIAPRLPIVAGRLQQGAAEATAPSGICHRAGQPTCNQRADKQALAAAAA